MRDTEESTVTSESNDEHTPSNNDEVATVHDNDQTIPTVTRWLDRLHLDSNMVNQPPSVANAAAGDSSGIKVNAPQEFYGARNKFEMFRMQCMLAIEMGGNKLSTDRKQVLYLSLIHI